jgi:hypothetical protein
MKFLNKLIKKNGAFQRTFGMKLDQFNFFIKKLEPHWEEAESQRKISKSRKRDIGGGHPYKFDLYKQMLIVLLYYKTYLTQEFLGAIIDLDQANVSRLLKKMLPLIEKAADPELAAYLAKAKEEYLAQSQTQRINNWGEFLKKHPDLKDISTDATEQECFRSQDYEQQKEHYSGKKKQHSLKTQISVSSTRRILDVSSTYPGSVHDKTIIDKEETVLKFPENAAHRFDSGYQGLRNDHPKHYLILPCKKPRSRELSDLEKEVNTTNSKRRVIVENMLAQLKKFRVLANLYRGPLESYNQIIRNIASILNFKLANQSII